MGQISTKIIGLLFFFLISINFLSAQQVVKGKIANENNKNLQGVVVIVKGTDFKTISNIDGTYKLIVPKGSKVLNFIKDEYYTKEVEITDEEINIVMTKKAIDIFDLTLEELMELEVYSTSKKNEKVIETPAAVNIITSDDIKLLNFNTLEQILEYATGLASINGEGNIFTTITIRGNTLINYNTNTLLLFDGIPLYNAYHGSFDFQSVPLSAIDRIEIIKGSNSVLYGSNAINGVINIISKKAKNDDENKVSGSVKYGSYNTFYTKGSIIKKKGDWEFYQFTDMITSSGETLLFTDEKENQLELQKNYKGISSVSKLTYKDFSLSFKYYSRNLSGLRTRSFKTLYTSKEDTVGILQHELSNEHSYLVNLEYDKKISEKLTLNIRSSAINWKLHKELYDGYWDYSSYGLYNDLNLSLKSSEKFYNKVGINYNHYLGRRFKSQKGCYDIGKDNIWTNDIAIFWNGEYQIKNSLKVFYGGRYYYAKYDETVFDNFSPRVALTFSPNQKIYFKAIFGQSFRIPTYFEKEVASSNVIGNPELLPENSTSYDFIISSKIKQIQFDFDIFYSKINNKIQRVTLPENPNLKINLNIGKISLYGGEFNCKFRIIEKIYGFIGYSYTEGIDLKTNEKLKYVFNNMVNFGTNIQLLSRLNINTSVKYMDKWGEASSYTLINLGLRIKPTIHLPLFIELKANNILDTDVYLPEIARESELVPTIPKTLNRMYFLGLSYNF